MKTSKHHIFVLIGIVGLLWFLGQASFRKDAETLPNGWMHPGPEMDMTTLALQDKTLWTGGKEGLLVLDTTTWNVGELPEVLQKIKDINNILIQDAKTLWIATDTGVYRYKNNQLNHYTDQQGLPDKRTNVLQMDAEGVLWAGTWKGLAKWDGQAFKAFDKNHQLLNPMVSAILFHRDHSLWIGSAVAPQGGVTVFQGDNVQTFNAPENLPHNNANCFLPLSETEMWIGTGFAEEGGIAVCKKTGDTWTTVEMFSKKNGIIGEKVRSLYQSSDNILLIATENDGVTLWKDKAIGTLTMEDGLRNPEVKVWCKVSDGTLCMGTPKGLVVVEEARIIE